MAFDISVPESDVTHKVVFGYDDEGEPNAYIEVIGKLSDTYQELQRKSLKMALQESSRRGRPLDFKKSDDAEDFLDKRESSALKLAIACTVGWVGLEDKSVEYPFTPENVKALYTNNPIVLGRVTAAIEDDSNFLKV